MTAVCRAGGGGRSSVGRAPVCGTGCRGFDPRRSPHSPLPPHPLAGPPMLTASSAPSRGTIPPSRSARMATRRVAPIPSCRTPSRTKGRSPACCTGLEWAASLGAEALLSVPGDTPLILRAWRARWRQPPPSPRAAGGCTTWWPSGRRPPPRRCSAGSASPAAAACAALRRPSACAGVAFPATPSPTSTPRGPRGAGGLLQRGDPWHTTCFDASAPAGG